MATGWQMRGKTEKRQALAETPVLQRPCELVFIGGHTFLREGWNNGAVLLIDQMSSAQTWRVSSAEAS